MAVSLLDEITELHIIPLCLAADQMLKRAENRWLTGAFIWSGNCQQIKNCVNRRFVTISNVTGFHLKKHLKFRWISKENWNYCYYWVICVVPLFVTNHHNFKVTIISIFWLKSYRFNIYGGLEQKCWFTSTSQLCHPFQISIDIEMYQEKFHRCF